MPSAIRFDEALPYDQHMNRLPVCLLSAACAALASRASSETLHVEVTSHKTALVETPVYVDVDLAPEPGSSVRVSSRGHDTPGQIEKLGNGKSRIWWIIDEIAASDTRRFTLEVGKREHDAREAALYWVPSSRNGLTSKTLMQGDRSVLRYMYTKFALDNKELTKKPYHHAFAPDGSKLITKGHGGLYPHHRGIFFGYRKCQVDGKTYDAWHAQKGEHEVHVAELRKIEGPVLGGHVVRIDWNDRAGKPFAKETRRVVVFRQSAGSLLIELQSHLETVGRPVDLRGDPQHAGVQFRAAQFVAEHKQNTTYLRPAAWKDLPEDKEVNFPGNKQHKDMPWDAIRFDVGKSPFTVAYLSHPANPDGAQSSERLYGRFGEYIPYDLREDHPLDLTYRWWITSSHDTTRAEIESRYQAIAAPPDVRLVE